MIYETTWTVTATQSDDSSIMKADALVWQLQYGVTEYLRACGITPQLLKQTHTLFILVKNMVQIHRLPKVGEQLHLQVWFGAEKFWIYPAHYRCSDSSGKIIAEASANWVPVSAETRRLCPPNEATMLLRPCNQRDDLTIPKRVPFPKEYSHCMQRTVVEKEIDFNGHMNNACYIAWGTALLDKSFLQQHTLRTIYVEYSRELIAGQCADLHYCMKGDTLYLHGTLDGSDAFRLKLEYASL